MEEDECTYLDLLVRCAEDQARMLERARLSAESRALGESSDDDGDEESDSDNEDEVGSDEKIESHSQSVSDNDKESHIESEGTDENSSSDNSANNNDNEIARNGPRVAADWQPVPTVLTLRHILRRAQLQPAPPQQTNPPWSTLSVQERQALYVPGPVPNRSARAARYTPLWPPSPPATPRKVFIPCFGASCPVGCTLDRHEMVEREEEGRLRRGTVGRRAAKASEYGTVRNGGSVAS